MKTKKTTWAIVLLVVATPIFLVYSTVSNSKDCSQLVIDTYEFYSGIDIPSAESVNCYYDEKDEIRVSVFELKSQIDLSQFESSSLHTSTDFLNGLSLLDETERPSGKRMHFASGEKKGTKWTYLVDNKTKRLWAELKYLD